MFWVFYFFSYTSCGFFGFDPFEFHHLVWCKYIYNFFLHSAFKSSSVSKYKRFEFEANGFDIFIVINTISGAYGVPQIQIQGQ